MSKQTEGCERSKKIEYANKLRYLQPGVICAIQKMAILAGAKFNKIRPMAARAFVFSVAPPDGCNDEQRIFIILGISGYMWGDQLQ